MQKSKRTKALEIPPKVKRIVHERDGYRCLVCGSYNGEPVAHFIRRSQGGKGVAENVVTLCYRCHMMFDQGCDRRAIEAHLERYLRSKYPDWDREKLYYKKGE